MRRVAGWTVAGLALWLLVAQQADAARRFTELGQAAASTPTSRCPCSSIATDCSGSARARACSVTTATRRRRSCPTRDPRAASATWTFARCTRPTTARCGCRPTRAASIVATRRRAGSRSFITTRRTRARSATRASTASPRTPTVGIWVGTQNGLNRLDADGRSFARYFHASRRRRSLAHDWVYAAASRTVADACGSARSAAASTAGMGRERPLRAFPARVTRRRPPRPRRRVRNSRDGRWPGLGRHPRGAGHPRPRQAARPSASTWPTMPARSR